MVFTDKCQSLGFNDFVKCHPSLFNFKFRLEIPKLIYLSASGSSAEIPFGFRILIYFFYVEIF